MSYKFGKKNAGFTLMETLVGVAVFLVVATAVYQAYTGLFLLVSSSQYKILALNLANEQFEIVRNLSYADVGEVSGIPNGKIPHTQTFVRGGVPFTVVTTIRNVDLPFDGTIDGTPDDLSPADNKLVEVEVQCSTCKNFTPTTLTTTVAPKNLETASTNGALFVKVFDANGQPVDGADVHIVKTSTSSPNIIIDDVTGTNGLLQIVDAPPGVNAYSITVSKPGYSTARTYPPGGAGNPNPTQPDATVVIQQITQVSFSIDKLSTLEFKSVTPLCEVAPGIDFSLKSSKNIGASVPKYFQNLVTNGSGMYSNSSMEWDSYTIAGIDSSYDIIGINPFNAVPVIPNSTQHVDLIVAPKNPRSYLVTVKDAGTGLPVTGATVALTNSSGYSSTQTTDRGSVNQTDWSEGDGQDTFTNAKKFFFNDGNIDVTSSPGQITLKNAFGVYNPTGYIESSTIDTGSASNFSNITWTPTDQPPTAGANSVKFQLATNKELTSTTTWDYKGPDGTASTYYTTSNNTVNPLHNGDRYYRYKVILTTSSSAVTPNVSDVAVTFTTLCTPPGQVVFSGLSNGTYHVIVSKTGYTTYDNPAINITNPWTEQIINLSQ